MAFIPVPNCVQARLIWQEDNGNVAQNVFYHATTGVPLLADLEAIGATWGELMTESGLIAVTTSNWALLSVGLRSMTEEEGIALNYSDGMPINGVAAGAALPDQVAYTVTWSTGLIGRSARGRTYGLGIMPAAVVDNKQLRPADQANYNNVWGIILDGFQTEGHALQVVSFQEGGVPRTEGRKLAILSQQVRFPLATQRRRLS